MRRSTLSLVGSAIVLQSALAAAATPSAHVLILSVDGLAQGVVTNPGLADDLQNVKQLASSGVVYSRAFTTFPSDSFPGTLAYLTGAHPGTTGVFYDDSFDRMLLPPGSTAGAPPGTEVLYAENLDKNSALVSGGGNFDASSIDPAQLPLNPTTLQPVFPSQFLKVNTIFNVAHSAGLYTAFSDKHPAYQLANGADSSSINDLYTPELNSNTALYSLSSGQTVNADKLLATDPFVDLSNYILVDPSTDPMGPTDPNLELTTNNVLLTAKYDDLKVQAIINEIDGKASHASPNITTPTVPNLFGMNFQAVSVAEKFKNGGIVRLPDGSNAPSVVLQSAVLHTDKSIGWIVAELQSRGLWNSTLLVVTAKHGQNPLVGVGGLMADSTVPDTLNNTGAQVAQATQDDVSLIWLRDRSQTNTGAQALLSFRETGKVDVFFQGTKVTLPAEKVIADVLYGPGLASQGLGDPTRNSRTPDIIVTLKPGYIWVGNPQNFSFKRAEHGGNSVDDRHVALIAAGGLVNAVTAPHVVKSVVETTQIAVSALCALGLDSGQLRGAEAEGTQPLPRLHFGGRGCDSDYDD